MTIAPLDAASVRYARFMRSGFKRGHGACDVVRSLLAVQAQDSEAALLSIYGRSSGKRQTLANDVLRGEGDVARVWGMRGTLQVVHRQDWAPICAAVRDKVTKTSMNSVRRHGCGEILFDRVMQEAVNALEGGDIVNSKDVEGWIERVISENPLKGLEQEELAFAKSCVKRSVHVLATVQGYGERLHPNAVVTGGTTSVVLAPRKEGTPWEAVEVFEAVKLCAVRFFSTYAPASERDFRYWMGIEAAHSKRAVRELEEEGALVAVSCTDDAAALLAHETVAAEVHATVAPIAAEWPVRLLGRFDPLLLAHESKSWLVGEENRRRIWTKNADITPTVLVRGRIRGQWRRNGAEITVRLFAPCKDDEWAVSAAEIAQIRARGLDLLTNFWCVGSKPAVIVVRELEGGGEEVVAEDSSEASVDDPKGTERVRRSKRKRKS